MRHSGRTFNALRDIKIDLNCAKYAEGSCLISCGDTKVLCTATVEEKVPPFLKESGGGWVTAEYGMLPRSVQSRISREAATGKQTGRTQEIQRLIGRSLRSVVDLRALGERQIKIDCDVIQADGGTRTASINGGFIALYAALKHLKERGMIKTIPLRDHVAAISCGIVKNNPLLDLDYIEDSSAEADANFVLTGMGNIVEIQTTAEATPFDEQQFMAMFTLAREGIGRIITLQKEILGL
jgi:ribonuclease PH